MEKDSAGQKAIQVRKPVKHKEIQNDKEYLGENPLVPGLTDFNYHLFLRTDIILTGYIFASQQKG